MESSYRILMLENNPNDAELIRKELRRGGVVFSSICVETQQQFTEQIKMFKPNVILSDYALPNFSGIAALKIAAELSPETLFIMVTGSIDDEMAAETIKSGAADYVLKEHLYRLVPAIKSALETKRVLEENRRVEENLKRSEERFRSLFENNPTMYFMLNSEGTVLSVNDFGAEQLGYTKDELIGQTVLKVFYEEDKAAVVKTLKNFLAHPQRIDHWQFRKVRKDGTMLYVEEAARVIQDSEGKTIVLIVCEDVTEQKKVEKELRTRELQQAAIAKLGHFALSGMDLPVLFEKAVDFVAEILEADYCKILKLLPNENKLLLIAGVGWKDGVVGNATVDAGVDSQAGYTLASKLPVIVEEFGLETRFHAPPLLRDHGVVSGMSVIIHGKAIPFGVLGVHSKKKRIFTADDVRFLEVVASVLGAVIDRKIAEDTLMEKEEELRQSQKMEAIGQLAGGIAHDFNNLLTAIMGYSDLVLNNLGEDHFLRSDVEEIRKAADRAAVLTRQLLAFSRKQMLESRVLVLNDTISNMDKMLRRLIGENLDLNIVLEPYLWSVKLDPAQIEQVLVNLTVNSRDAMPNGGQLTFKTSNIALDEVYARQQSGLKPGNYVMLSVDDTGMGMSKETKEHIFEPFFTTKEKGRGTGLGLATVYGVVKQTGGHISVYSEPGKGTSFKIYFPRAEEAVKEEISHQPIIRPKSTRGSETILLVEDEGIVRKLAKDLLEMSGYKVLAAKDADEAIKISGEYKGSIHLLVTDIVIPKMDGRELSKKIISKRPDIKVLFISGYTENSVLHQGILDPGVAFYQKPFTADGLTSKVREVLESSSKSMTHKRAA